MLDSDTDARRRKRIWDEAESESDDDDAYNRRALKQLRKVCARNDGAAVYLYLQFIL